MKEILKIKKVIRYLLMNLVNNTCTIGRKKWVKYLIRQLDDIDNIHIMCLKTFHMFDVTELGW